MLEQTCEKVATLKAHYERGGLGDIAVKKYLNKVLQNLLEPIRQKRKLLEQDIDALTKSCTRERKELKL